MNNIFFNNIENFIFKMKIYLNDLHFTIYYNWSQTIGPNRLTDKIPTKDS
jgi:hypothetical protein